MSVDGTHKEIQNLFQNVFNYRVATGRTDVVEGTKCELNAPFAHTKPKASLLHAKECDVAVGIPRVEDKKASFDSEHVPICVIEVTSDGNDDNDLKTKVTFYKSFNYIIVHRSAKTVLNYKLKDDGIYDSVSKFEGEAKFSHELFGDLVVKDIFNPPALASAAVRTAAK